MDVIRLAAGADAPETEDFAQIEAAPDGTFGYFISIGFRWIEAPAGARTENGGIFSQDKGFRTAEAAEQAVIEYASSNTGCRTLYIVPVS